MTMSITMIMMKVNEEGQPSETYLQIKVKKFKALKISFISM